MENQCNPQPVVNIDQLKKGNVFEVVIDGNKQHPVVLMEDFQQGHKRIHAVGFSHDDRHNICFPKKYVVNPDDINDYSFKWENNRGQTSIIPLGFDKKIVYLHKFIGRIVVPDGIEFINKHIREYVECDIPIKDYVHQHENSL